MTDQPDNLTPRAAEDHIDRVSHAERVDLLGSGKQQGLTLSEARVGEEAASPLQEPSRLVHLVDNGSAVGGNQPENHVQ